MTTPVPTRPIPLTAREVLATLAGNQTHLCRRWHTTESDEVGAANPNTEAGAKACADAQLTADGALLA